MNRKYKGQGALEYLLLIGGAVLIAVIVIALLVGMGGQSRDAAQEQADRAQQAADVPQPAQIVSVNSLRENCVGQLDTAEVTFTWRPIGEGGVYRLIVTDSSGTELDVSAGAGVVGFDADDLDPTDTTAIAITVDIETPGNLNCGDSYYLQIETTKNQQTVRSQRYRFSWSS